MKISKVGTFFVSLGIFVFLTGNVFCQAQFKVGDTIYVNAFYAGCVKAKGTGTDPKYSVRIEEGQYKDRETFYNANRVGDCNQGAPQDNQPQGNQNQNGDEPANDQPAPHSGNLKVGDRVDVYLSGNIEGKNRGTIVETRDSQYKIHYDGCKQRDDVWENISFVRPAATISSGDPAIRFLVGKWSMTSVGVNSDALGTTAAWGRAPGIQINGDGTYTWYQGGGKAPVKGIWTTHAKIEGARFGTETENGIIIKDAVGTQWKMYRRKSTIDNGDHVTIRSMCESLTQMGTRIR